MIIIFPYKSARETEELKRACAQDSKTAKDFHPKIRFKRIKDLMHGDDCCDHTYYWKEWRARTNQVFFRKRRNSDSSLHQFPNML